MSDSDRCRNHMDVFSSYAYVASHNHLLSWKKNLSNDTGCMLAELKFIVKIKDLSVLFFLFLLMVNSWVLGMGPNSSPLLTLICWLQFETIKVEKYGVEKSKNEFAYLMLSHCNSKGGNFHFPCCLFNRPWKIIEILERIIREKLKMERGNIDS